MKTKLDFIGGNTRRCLMAMALPMIAAMFLNMMYNLVDSLWIGNLLGETAYAALTNSTPILLILTSVAMGATNGISILLSQAICLLFMLIYLKKKKLFAFRISAFDRKEILPLIQKAIPSVIQQSIPAVSTTFLTALVNAYSVTAIAAYGVTGKLETILFYPAMAMNMVLTTIVGQCVGGARYDRAKDYLKCALGYGCGLLVILSAVVIGFSGQLSGMFIKSDDVASIVRTYFLIVSVGYILNTVTNCYLGTLNGMGKPSGSMFLMIFYYIVVRMPLAYLLSRLSLGLNGIWVAVLISHIVASVAAYATVTLLVKKKCV